MASLRFRKVQHKVGSGEEEKKIPADVVPDSVEPSHVHSGQRKHKPVIDLFSHRDVSVQKFTLLAACNPDVKHTCVGHLLDREVNLAAVINGKYSGKNWDPDEQAKEAVKSGQGSLIQHMRRMFSSKDVLEFLGGLSDESINRINIDYGFPGRKVIAECMRVLEPGGGIEFTTVESERETSERAFKQMRLHFREEAVTPLDLKSELILACHNNSIDSPAETPIKFILEKPGVVSGVDQRSFFERLTPGMRGRLKA